MRGLTSQDSRVRSDTSPVLPVRSSYEKLVTNYYKVKKSTQNIIVIYARKFLILMSDDRRRDKALFKINIECL